MSEAVLVLNANYEPINVCNLRRAIGLILTEKASLVVMVAASFRLRQALTPVHLSFDCNE
jgi:hypothetical protein